MPFSPFVCVDHSICNIIIDYFHDLLDVPLLLGGGKVIRAESMDKQ
jgi:hypothetical protein